MKNNQEIADLIFKDPDSMEPIVRAIHLTMPEFLHWIRNTPSLIEQTYWTMGFIQMPFVGVNAFYHAIQERKPEILKHFNAKFNVPKN